MQNYGKKLAALLLAVCMLLALTACRSGGDGGQVSGRVYVPEFIEFDLAELGIQYVNGGCCDGTYVYMLAEAEQEVEQVDPFSGETYMGYEYRTSIFSVALDGSGAMELENYEPSKASEEAVDRESYFYIESISTGADGTLWVTESLEEYIYDVPENFDPTMDFLWNYEMIENRRVQLRRQLDATGREIARVESDGLEEKVLGTSDGYIGSMVVDREGNSYIFAEVYSENAYETKIVVMDSGQNVLFEMDTDNLWGQLILLGDGLAAMSCYVSDPLTGEGGQKLRTIDMAERTWGEEYPLPMNVGSVYAGTGRYLFYYDNGDSLYGYDARKGEGEKLLTWSSSDINRNDLRFFTFLDDGRVAAMTNSWGENGMEAEIILLTEQDASALAERTTLSFATMYLSYDMREKIIDFNKSQNKYRIEIRDYSEFNTADDYDAGLTKLNTEIIAGQVPDILDTNGLNIRQYGAKGLLEDLWPYIEADEALSREGVMQNVLQAAEQNGALYQIFSSFNIRTLTGASVVVGKDMSWTLEELYAALEKMPEGCTLFSEGDTKESMLHNVMAMQMDHFVDWTTGECHFDSDGFVSLLEFCNSFPLKYDWNSYDPYEYEDEYTRISEGRQMLTMEYLYDFQSIQIQKHLFGGDITYVGYPMEDGGVGSSFVVESGLAMSTACKDKEGAWLFMRESILPQSNPEDEYFYFNGWGFPVNKQDFDRMALQYMTPRYILDETGSPMLDENGQPMEESQGGIGWGDGQMLELYATSQEEYDQIMALYGAIDSIYRYDEKIYTIVLDVAQRYFNEDITSQEAAEQIQSRVKLYVNENL